MSIKENLTQIKSQLPKDVTLVAVSKTKPIELLQEAYDAGQRIFGENKAQELKEKHAILPKDIEWHFIGHLQTNKIKYIAPFVHLIHAVDSLKLLIEINKKAKANNRVINCLLQIKIAIEEEKFGLSTYDTFVVLSSEEFKELKNIKIVGLMGMATNTKDTEIITKEFDYLYRFFKFIQLTYPEIETLSMGMSNDYSIAIKSGSTMIRVGSSIFGARNY